MDERIFSQLCPTAICFVSPIVCGFIGSAILRKKGHSGLIGFILGVFGNLIGVFIAVLIPKGPLAGASTDSGALIGARIKAIQNLLHSSNRWVESKNTRVRTSTRNFDTALNLLEQECGEVIDRCVWLSILAYTLTVDNVDNIINDALKRGDADAQRIMRIMLRGLEIENWSGPEAYLDMHEIAFYLIRLAKSGNQEARQALLRTLKGEALYPRLVLARELEDNYPELVEVDDTEMREMFLAGLHTQNERVWEKVLEDLFQKVHGVPAERAAYFVGTDVFEPAWFIISQASDADVGPRRHAGRLVAYLYQSGLLSDRQKCLVSENRTMVVAESTHYTPSEAGMIDLPGGGSGWSPNAVPGKTEVFTYRLSDYLDDPAPLGTP